MGYPEYIRNLPQSRRDNTILEAYDENKSMKENHKHFIDLVQRWYLGYKCDSWYNRAFMERYIRGNFNLDESDYRLFSVDESKEWVNRAFMERYIKGRSDIDYNSFLKDLDIDFVRNIDIMFVDWFKNTPIIYLTKDLESTKVPEKPSGRAKAILNEHNSEESFIKLMTMPITE